jgi:hypothetical protein
MDSEATFAERSYPVPINGLAAPQTAELLVCPALGTDAGKPALTGPEATENLSEGWVNTGFAVSPCVCSVPTVIVIVMFRVVLDRYLDVLALTGE